MSQLFRLKNGTVLLSTEAPGGIYNSGQLKKIAELCSKELAIVKATEDQRLALFVKESEVENVAKQLRAMGLGFRHYQDSLHQPVSCLGELCEEHEQPAMATAMDITKEIASIQLNAPLKIGINGCARCCTPCHTLDIAVVGDASGYRISLGGKTQQMPEFASYFAEGVPAKELPKRLKSVIEAFKNLAEEGESLHDVIERCGVTDFVQALAPYSQDAAHREDPFAKEAAAGESVDDLALSNDELDDLEDLETSADSMEAEAPASTDEDALSLDDDTPAVELSGDLGVEDDLSIADDTLDDGALDEIPIEKSDEGLLEDDLSLGNDDASLEMNDVSFSEDAAEDITDDSLVDDAALSEDSLSEDAELEASDDVLLDSGDDALLEDASMESSATAELDEHVDLGSDDVELDTHAAVTEDDIDLDAPDLDVPGDAMDTLPDNDTDLDLDESMALDDDLPEDMKVDLEDDIEDIDDTSMNLAETPVDEDLEGIPELDEDLALEELPPAAPAAKAPASKPAPSPSPAALHEDFGEELPPDMPELSDEEESQFEQKLHASIDEESRLIAKADKDPNVGDRQAALSLLENSDHVELSGSEEAIDVDDVALDEPVDMDDELEEISSEDELETISAEDALDSDMELTTDDEIAVADDTEKADEVLEPIQETMEEFPEPGPTELAHIKSRQLGQKLQGTAPRQQFKVSAITFQDEHMRVTFESGAYVDFDLSALGLGEERNFRLGVQNVSVTSTSEGYILEVDGMRLFHPKTSLPAAS